MWPNEARERVAVFSNPPMNTEMYAYVREGDERFADGDYSKINSPDYTIGVIDGSMETFIATEDYPEAELYSLPQLTSFSELFLSVTTEKADITFSEPSAVEGFNDAQSPDLVKVNSEPVRTFGNSFAFLKENTELAEEWNEALSQVIASGEVEAILTKYGVEDYYVVND
jgi:ABC-type amino acid transport substrate-binding protein